MLRALLRRRVKQGKEDETRVQEKMAIITCPRPDGRLLWVHAASVGEIQSALIVIDACKSILPDLNILITTGTLTSAKIVETRKPDKTIHQFAPLDHPVWARKFLNHWKPDMILWMESELWPNILREIHNRRIPCFLVNARLSEKSFRRWMKLKHFALKMLAAFDKIFCQTEQDKTRFSALGVTHASVTGNIKYSAAPLPFDPLELAALKEITKGRPLWLYASTHKGEEDLACRIHQNLKPTLPNLLTIIVPRHPERTPQTLEDCASYNLHISCRGRDKKYPSRDDDIYIADTLGELGLLYSLAPLACIGRTFSDDGGGGHNPIEPVQLGCAVLHGERVQNLQEIFDDMDSCGAALNVHDEKELEQTILHLLTQPDDLHALQDKGKAFALSRAKIIDTLMHELRPALENMGSIKNAP